MLTAVVPFRGGDAGRLEAAKFVLRHLKALGAQVIVVEHDCAPTDLECDTHILFPDSGPFNRSACFNVGALSAMSKDSSPDLLFTDADIFCSRAALFEAVSGLSYTDVISPYSRIADLNLDKTLDLQRSGVVTPSDTDPLRGGTNLAGGAVLMTLRAWRTVGGWDPRMAGWGGEDDLMTHSVVSLGLRHKSLDHLAHHMWHARREVLQQQYQRNCEHLDLIRSLSVADLRVDAERRLSRLVDLGPALGQ